MTRLFGAEPDVRLAIEDAGQDSGKQAVQIAELIRQKPDLLIVAPNDRASVTALMGQATQAGIPTISLGSDISQPNYTTCIRADNAAIGHMAGEFIINYLIKKYGRPVGSIVQMRGLPGAEEEAERDAGAKAVFAQYPNVRIFAEPAADWLEARAYDRMTELLRAYPVIDVAYGHNDPMAFGAYLAARELEREQAIAFVGIDGLGGAAGGIKMVMDGVLAATFVYPLCVDQAVEIGNRILRKPGFRPEKQYHLDTAMVTTENAAARYAKLSAPGQ